MTKFSAFFLLFLGATLSFAQGLSLPIDFESTTQVYTFNDFSGGIATVIANPQSNGINTSTNVGKMVKGAGDPWAGSYMTMENPLDFSVNRTFKMKVFSPRVGARALLKVENLTTGSIFFQTEDTVTVANAWEELTFDFSYADISQSYSKLVFIFDLGVVGDGTSNFTFLFDDVQLVYEGPYQSRIDLPISFNDTTVDYTLTDFGGNYSVLATDPTGGTNKVAKTVKTLGAATWAGTTMGVPRLATPIPVTPTQTKMNVRVYSPKVGIPVRLKIEDANDPTRSVETQTNTTLANAWETIEFDFSNEATGTAVINFSYTFNMASIFFNFNSDGVAIGADSVYYWDDVKFGPASSVGIEKELKANLTYYPNPVHEQFFIQAEGRIDAVSLYNQMGQMVFKTRGENNEITLDMKAFAPGVYVAKVRVGETVGAIRILKY
ncbi:MAG: T9SS type A sorting domain-containing protein [Bacteroidia bacterium]|nr:T9SS type A sorting domain-containing protein [Bacteroidia bacterium]